MIQPQIRQKISTTGANIAGSISYLLLFFIIGFQYGPGHFMTADLLRVRNQSVYLTAFSTYDICYREEFKHILLFAVELSRHRVLLNLKIRVQRLAGKGKTVALGAGENHLKKLEIANPKRRQ